MKKDEREQIKKIFDKWSKEIDKNVEKFKKLPEKERKKELKKMRERIIKWPGPHGGRGDLILLKDKKKK